jgi:hypothetical protein
MAMGLSLVRNAFVPILLVGLIAPGIAFAQVPRADDNPTCTQGDTGQTGPSPGGGQMAILFPNSLNCGGGSLAGAPGATAIGDHAIATGTNSTAIGRGATATGTSSTALGAGATATFNGSTAIGAGARTTTANQVMLGGGGTSVRIGDIGASTAAQSGPLSLVTVDSSGTLGVDISTLPRMRRDARQGVAAAVAIGYAPMPSAPGRTSYAVNVATFRGEQAVGGSITYRLPTADPIAFTAGFSHAGNRNNAARVGIAGEF